MKGCWRSFLVEGIEEVVEETGLDGKVFDRGFDFREGVVFRLEYRFF